jgi:hypothetical protein
MSSEAGKRKLVLSPVTVSLLAPLVDGPDGRTRDELSVVPIFISNRSACSRKSTDAPRFSQMFLYFDLIWARLCLSVDFLAFDSAVGEYLPSSKLSAF